ncbi:hypothetical protein PVAND_009483 [Polypedilum vanderplanki]|uniref:Uncharacterized protein n=1 Tax=Polypedilum vanderplanki TaxID=319348 RepID=A0A9J6CCW1_POLVA|nr:hypothetical protein PVAND_009483 [Polypedilum vanderplanki]
MDTTTRSMEPVHNFTNELFSIYDFKVPISKAKMGSITKSAMKAIKFYKHVVQNVEKFILKCKPEYKIPGLYVIDSIVRQSRHQFGPEKDVFAPRFARNMEETFAHLFRCSQEDKSKIIRVLNLWQKNNVFAPEVIQPLFDLASADHPIHQQYMQQQQQQQQGQQQGDISNGMNIARDSPHQKDDGNNAEILNASNLQKFQYQQMMQQQQVDQMGGNSTMDSVKFNKQLLEYDYGSDADDDKGVDAMQLSMQQQYQAAAAAGMTSGLPYQFTKCLEDPNVLKQLQNINKIDVQRYLNELPGASNSMMMDSQQPQSQGITLANINSLRGPQPIIDNSKDQDVELISETMAEVIPIDISSRSPTPTRHKRRRSRSHSRDRYGSRRRRSRSRSTRSRSRSPRRRRSSRERTKDKDREKQREIEKERRRKGLPDIKKDHISVCSTTIWVGHLSKLVQQEELSDTFGKYGDIVSIDMIPPRGCAYIVMNRRQDAHKAMQALKNHKMQNRAITLSWAAGKGVKGKEWKDYFDQTLGVTYIPYSKLTHTTDFEALEEGGMYDEETLPTWVKEKMKQPTAAATKDGLIMPPFFGLPTDVSTIDTSQPPPNASLLQPIPPFPLGNIPRLLMPGVLPLGVPPPNMLGNMIGVFPSAASLDKTTTIPPPNLLGFPLSAATQQANITTANQQQASGDDHMDIEMEDEHHSLSGKSQNDVANLMQQAFYNQPPPQIQSLLMQATTQAAVAAASNLLQNSSNNNSSNNAVESQNDEYTRMNNNRNNRSQSREKDYRRGSRQDFNNRRWPNDSNGRGGNDNRRDNNNIRSRDGNQNNFNRRSGHQQDIPSLLSQPMPPLDGDNNLTQRQRNNDFNNRDDFNDRRQQQFGNHGFNNQQMRGNNRGGQSFRGGNFGNRGNMRGGYNNFNDRQGFHDRDSNQRGGRNAGGRNWNREDDNNDRRGGNFQQRGANNFDRNNRNNKRWMGNQRQDDFDGENSNDQNDSNDATEQNSRNENFENSNDYDNQNQNNQQQQQQEDDALPPGTENETFNDIDDDYRNNEISNQPSSNELESGETFNNNNNDNESIVNETSVVDDVNTGNTTPLCDEAKE